MRAAAREALRELCKGGAATRDGLGGGPIGRQCLLEAELHCRHPSRNAARPLRVTAEAGMFGSGELQPLHGPEKRREHRVDTGSSVHVVCEGYFRAVTAP